MSNETKPHVQRMIDELDQLNERITGLCTFINTNPLYKGLHGDERHRMILQRDAMRQYRDVLEERIKAAK